MSVLAVLLAVTTVMGGRTHEDAVLNQNRATDQWNEYQAQKIREYNTQLISDLMTVVALDNKDAAAKLAKSYTDHEKKWATELTRIRRRPLRCKPAWTKEKRRQTGSISAKCCWRLDW